MKRNIYNLSQIILGLTIALTFFGNFDAGAQTDRPRPVSAAPTPTATPKASPTPGKTTATEEEEVIKIESKLVVVPVSVSDVKGELVKNLQAGDFLLQESGKKQEIDRLSNPDQVPLDIALLIDVSGSVGKRFPFEKDAATRFLRQVIQTADSVTIYAIDQQPVLVQARTDLGTAIAKLNLIEPKLAATAFFDTVAEAAQRLTKDAKPGHRRVVIIISDGEDTYSDKYKSAAATIRELQQTDTLFYSINPGGGSLHLNQMSRRGQDVMAQMATATGGVAFVPETDKDLEATFQQIAAELRSQYLLQYYPAGDTAKKGFIPISVRIPARPELRIRARQGYYLQP